MRINFERVRINHEISPTTGKHHLQGTFILKKALKHYEFMRFEFMNEDKEVGITGAWAQGCIYPDKAWDYCSKEDSRWNNEFYEMGERPAARLKQGKRSDLDRYFEAVKNGASDSYLAANFTKSFGLYHKNAKAVRGALEPKSFKVVNRRLVLCLGPSGCGKSYFALHTCEQGPRGDAEDTYVPVVGKSNWFDGYDGQHFAVWHEYSGGRSGKALDDFNQIMDEYPSRVEIKGTTTIWKCENIVLCSNYPPWDWWDWFGREQKYTSVWRRFNVVYVWPGDWKPVYDDNGDQILNRVEPTKLVRGTDAFTRFFTDKVYKVAERNKDQEHVNHPAWAIQ